jgi:hypothetical protein
MADAAAAVSTLGGPLAAGGYTMGANILADAEDDDALEEGCIMDADADEADDCGGAREAALAETWRGMRRAFRSAALG